MEGIWVGGRNKMRGKKMEKQKWETKVGVDEKEGRVEERKQRGERKSEKNEEESQKEKW